MSKTSKFRQSDVIILLSYPLLPIVYFAASARSAAGASHSFPIIVRLVAAACCLVILPLWTIFHVVRSKGHICFALIVGEGLLAFLWISAGLYAARLDSFRGFVAMVVAALVSALVFYGSHGVLNRHRAADFLENQANSANPTASN